MPLIRIENTVCYYNYAAALVLDEADRLLDSSFEEDLGVIFDNLPSKRQTLLFSATLTDTLSRLKEVALNEPFYWQAKAE